MKTDRIAGRQTIDIGTDVSETVRRGQRLEPCRSRLGDELEASSVVAANEARRDELAAPLGPLMRLRDGQEDCGPQIERLGVHPAALLASAVQHQDHRKTTEAAGQRVLPIEP